MVRSLAVLSLWAVLALAACGPSGSGGEAAATVDPDTLSRRQKDSILSTLPIPQSRAVGQALGSAEAAAARAAEIESEQGR